MQWFSNLRALPKLVISFGLLTFLTTATGLLALSRLSEESGRVVTAYSKDIDGVALVDGIALAKVGMARLTRDAIIRIKNKEVVEKDVAAFDVLAVSTRKKIEESQAIFAGQDGEVQVKEVAELFPVYVQLCKVILTRVQVGDAIGSMKALADVEPIATKLNLDTAAAADAKHRRALQISAESHAGFGRSRILLISMISACALIGVSLSLWIGRMFSIPLGKTVALLRRVAEGDLTGKLEIDTREEVGDMAIALNDALEKMRGTIEQVADSSENVHAASQELAASTDSISNGAQNQAASLEQTAAALEQITASVRQSSEHLREANQLAVSSGASADEGGKVVSDAIASMNEISEASSKIADIISTIDEIAFQTNLLAVNAAVEAARAGEQGRGFAVVAAEVRSLAQRSAAAAKQIKSLIQDSLRKVRRGSDLVNHSGETLNGIVTSVNRVKQIVAQITSAAEEQTSGIEQVNAAMAQVDSVTQSNSAQTEELSATADSLSSQSERLLELVNTFTIRRTEKTKSSTLSPLAARKANQSQVLHPAAKPRVTSIAARRPSGRVVSYDAARELAGSSSRGNSRVHAPADLEHSFEEF